MEETPLVDTRAADALLIEAKRAFNYPIGPCPWPDKILEHPEKFPSLNPWTRTELFRAAEFLVRLGVMRGMDGTPVGAT